MAAESNLTAAHTRFIGREDELASFGAALERFRVLTIVGAPGVGKSRLGLALALAYRDLHDGHHVFGIDLGAVVDRAGLLGGVAAEVGLQLPASGDLDAMMSHVPAALARRGPMLLFFDHAENVVDDLTVLVAAAWRHSELAILIASRIDPSIPLAPDDDASPLPSVRGRTMRLEPFPLPPASTDGSTTASMPGDISGGTDFGSRTSAALSHGEQLFLERARAARPTFEPDAGTLLAIRSIVRRVDGLPLAIELVAGRIDVLSPQRLDERLAEEPASEEAYGRLDGVLMASWRLLGEEQQSCLSQLAIFDGGFDLHAAQSVVHLEGDAPPVVEVLSFLRRASLVEGYDARATSDVRLSLLGAVRSFAAAQLDARGEREGVMLRHARHYADRANQWQTLVRRGQAGSALAALSIERHNLRAVVTNFAESSVEAHRELAARALLGLHALWIHHGPLAAFWSTAATLLAEGAFERLPPPLRAELLLAMARSHALAGDLAEATVRAEQAYDLLVAHGDEEGAIGAASIKGFCHWQAGDLELAHQVMEPAYRRARHHADCRRLAAVLANNLGSVARERGDLKAARAWCSEALKGYRALGNARGEGIARIFLGELHRSDGELLEARAEVAAGLELVAEADDQRQVGIAHLFLGQLDQQEGRFDQAQEHIDQAIAAHRQLGSRGYEALAHLAQAELTWERASPGAALPAIATALAVAHDLEDRWATALILASAGGLEALLGRPGAAARLERARELAERVADPRLVQAVARHSLFTSVRAAEQAAAAGDAASARALLATVTGCGDADPTPMGSQGGPSQTPAWSYLTFVNRMLDVAASRVQRRLSAGAPLVVDGAGDWFVTPAGERGSLGRRSSLRRVLACLAQRRQDCPGVAVAGDELLAVGWPGEIVLPKAGRNRVYVAIATLRKLGLGPLVLQRDEGYLLDPVVPLERRDLDP